MQYCKNRLNINVVNTSDKQTKDDLNTGETLYSDVMEKQRQMLIDNEREFIATSRANSTIKETQGFRLID